MTSLTGNACSKTNEIMDVGATARRAALSGVSVRHAKSVALLLAFQRSGGKGVALNVYLTPQHSGHMPIRPRACLASLGIFGCVGLGRSASGLPDSHFLV
jgi:hypothetical protein